MLIQLTEAELKHFEDIRQKYAKENRKKNEDAYTASVNYYDEWTAYYEECQRKRFTEIATDPQAILDHAAEQIPQIIDLTYMNITGSLEAGWDKRLFQEQEILTFKGEKAYFNLDFIIRELKNEFKLHFEALKDDKPRLQKLNNIIIAELKKSGYIDTSEDITKILPEVSPRPKGFIRPPLRVGDNFGFMNDKVNHRFMDEAAEIVGMINSHNIFRQKADGQLYFVWKTDQSPDSVKKQVVTTVALSYKGEDTKLNSKLTAFDEAVADAINNLFFYEELTNSNNPLYFTPADVWRQMNGKKAGDTKSRPSNSMIDRITNSIEKMRFIDMYIDISEELKNNYITIDDDRIIEGKIRSYMLNCDFVEFRTVQGREIAGYRLNKIPILYKYNRAKNHIVLVPFDLLDTSQYLNDGEYVTEFKMYLLLQIKLMYEGYIQSHKIKLSTIYKKTGTPTPEERIKKRPANESMRRKKDGEENKLSEDELFRAAIKKASKADRDKIEKLLTAWKEKNWIAGFTPSKAGKAIDGYNILLDKEQQKLIDKEKKQKK